MFRDIHFVIITNFVVVSSVGIKRVDRISKRHLLKLLYLQSCRKCCTQAHFSFASGTDDESDSQTSNGPMMSEHEFITYLIEMVCCL